MKAHPNAGTFEITESAMILARNAAVACCSGLEVGTGFSLADHGIGDCSLE